MKRQSRKAPEGGFGVQDVLFVLFRHKWKILIFTLIGLGAAAGVYFTQKPLYQSQAKLFVRYVIDRSEVDQVEQKARPGGRSSQYVIDTEKEILTSQDLATEVAKSVGVDRLLPGAPPGTPPSAAAGAVLSGLEVVSPLGGNVIHVSYSSPDPELSQEVLNELIQHYFVNHLEIHRSSGAFEFVSEQAEEARKRLRKAEEALNEFRLKTGILSLPDAMEALESRRSQTQLALMGAKAQLEEQRARIKSIEESLGSSNKNLADSSTTPDNGSQSAPGDVDTAQERANAESDYRALARQLDFLRKRRMELLTKYTATNKMVESIDRQIAAVKQQGLDLVEKHPELVGLTEKGETTTGPDLDAEKSRLAALEAKVKALEEEVQNVENEAKRIYKASTELAELERQKQMAEEKFRYLESSLDKARVDEALDPSKIPNIGVIQKPSPPVKVYDEKTKKLILGLAAGGLLLGIAIAFLIEMVIDHRIKRPVEISTRLQLPLMLSIPYFRLKHQSAGNLPLHEEDEQNAEIIPSPEGSRERQPASLGQAENFFLRYSKAIRDRIMFNFEVNNLTHKPKLVALAGLSRHAGASTLAVGIAKAFAEVPGMKVLLVDLDSDRPGKPPMLPGQTPESLLGVLRHSGARPPNGNTPNLFFASASTGTNGNSSSSLAPLQLYGLIPKLQASDFDYIIFDMPTLDPTSPTIAMAGLMDKVLLVLDAENTTREELKWGYSELTRGNADVSCIFNKARTHAPRWIDGGV